MAPYTLAVLFCSLLFFTQEGQVSSAPRIVRGRDAQPRELPYQVGIQRKYYFGGGSFHWCGGTIITRHHVMTAAHCLSGLPVAELQVFAGVINNTWQSEEPTKVLRDVFAVYMHEEFIYDSYFNDIAILTVTEDFPTDNTAIWPIPLAMQDPIEGTMCSVSGWGAMENGTYPTALQVVQVPFISHRTCEQLYSVSHNESILPGMVCAGYPEGGMDACGGDSGGPLVCGGYLVGVVSTGEGCAQPNYPGIYADVPYYGTWIARIMARSEYDLYFRTSNV